MYPDEIYTIGAVLGLIATLALCIFVIPRSKDGKLGAFGQYLHNQFNFKSLWIEGILKFSYTLSTCACIFVGFFTLFADDWYFDEPVLTGLVLMFAGPVVIRLAYEMMMMLIILVKNVIDINRKLPAEGTVKNIYFTAPAAPAAPEAPKAPVYRFCTSCGTKYDINAGGCPNCSGKEEQ